MNFTIDFGGPEGKGPASCFSLEPGVFYLCDAIGCYAGGSYLLLHSDAAKVTFALSLLGRMYTFDTDASILGARRVKVKLCVTPFGGDAGGDA